MGLSDTVSPLLTTPPSPAQMVNIIRPGQDADPLGSAIPQSGQLVHTQDAQMHFSHSVLMGELWP